MSCIPSWRTRARGLLPILRVCERRQVLYSTSTIHSYKPRHGASRRAGLISTHRFPVSLLLFHNHRSLHVAIRGSHPSLLYPGFLTLPFTLLLFHPFSSFPAPPSFSLSPLLYMPIIYPHNGYIGLYCTISSYTGSAARDDAYDAMLGLHHNAEL